jgi:hypothetical protein
MSVLAEKPQKQSVRLTKSEMKDYRLLKSKLEAAKSVIEVESYERQLMRIIEKAVLRQENEKKKRA